MPSINKDRFVKKQLLILVPFASALIDAFYSLFPHTIIYFSFFLQQYFHFLLCIKHCPSNFSKACTYPSELTSPEQPSSNEVTKIEKCVWVYLVEVRKHET